MTHEERMKAEWEAINTLIKEGHRHGLLAELIWSALQYTGGHDESIIEACDYGIGEWIK